MARQLAGATALFIFTSLFALTVILGPQPAKACPTIYFDQFNNTQDILTEAFHYITYAQDTLFTGSILCSDTPAPTSTCVFRYVATMCFALGPASCIRLACMGAHAHAAQIDVLA